jgi:UDP-2,3-diacylglucosamine pyrophosphatase LpxH
MSQNKIQIKLHPDAKVLIVSDIHLRLPITRELDMIQKSLVARIKQLAANQHAVLILNGDIFELWEQSSQTVSDIAQSFSELTKAIADFAGNNHQVIYTVGNHDEDTMNGQSSRAVLKKLWRAKAVVSLELIVHNKTVLIEHGHEHDSYNKSGNNGATHGKTLVKSTLPKLVKNMPTLFSGISDVINRAYLPSYVLSRLVYVIIMPIVFPLTLVFCAYFYIVGRDPRFALAFAIVWGTTWLFILLIDNIIRLVAKHTLGVGSAYIKDLDRYQTKQGFDVLILGHTHQGGVWKRPSYTYANSGCNDTVAIPRLGWLGLHKFDRFVQMSDITIDPNKKQPFIYNEQLVPLVK